MKEKFESMLEQGKRYIENGNQREGLPLIKQGLVGLKDEISFGHCFEIGMALTAVKDSSGNRILDWHRVATWLLQKCVDNETGMKFLENNGQQQVIMIITGMLNAAKGELGESIDNICHSAMRFLMQE
jgi:hypothetical protein